MAMMKIFFYILTSYSVFLISCAPIRVKEHQVDGFKTRCGIGSKRIALSDGTDNIGYLEVTRNDQRLNLFALIDRDPKNLNVATDPIKITYANRATESIVPKRPTSAEGISLEIEFSYLPKDFEVELPKVRYKGNPLKQQKFKFKYNDNWQFTALNGC